MRFPKGPPLDIHPTIKLMAATVVGLKRDGSATAAAEVERIGKMVYGDRAFENAVREVESDGHRARNARMIAGIP